MEPYFVTEKVVGVFIAAALRFRAPLHLLHKTKVVGLYPNY
jgi:hypothetical protein